MSPEPPPSASSRESVHRAEAFARAASPLLDPLGVEILLASGDAHDLPALVSVIERLDLLKAMAESAGVEPAWRLSAALSDLVSAILCEKAGDPDAAMAVAADAFGGLKTYVETLGGGAEDPSTCLLGLEKVLAFLTARSLLPASNTGVEPFFSGQAPTDSPLHLADGEGAGNEDFASTGLPGKFDDIDIYKGFASECEEHLETIEEKILALEETPDDENLIDEVFRPIHSMKGGAGFLGLAGINRLAHDTETLLDRCRKKELRATGEVAEVCLQSVDALKQMIANLRRAANSPDPFAEEVRPVVFGPIRRAIQRFLEGPDVSNGTAGAKTDGERRAGSAAGKEPRRLGEILVESGEITATELEEALQLQDAPLGELLAKTRGVAPEVIERALEKQRQAAGGAPAWQGPRAVKVDTNKIDDLVNLSGELVILECQVVQALSGDGRRERALDRNLSQLGKIAKEMQGRSLALRMMPVRQVFQKMTRVVRDSSKRVGKKAELVVSGEDTEIDRAVVEQIGDPLVHILRNCIDHGIETPEERLALGKPETGVIRLDAFRQGDRIAIRVQDDGKGLDRERIVEKAIQTGLLKPGADPGDSEMCALIFEPGFTTAREVTDISGRGVGMDVVRRNIEDLRGTIEIVSVRGQGLTLTIRLPLTLALIDGMIVRIGNEEYVVPTGSILEAVRPRREEVSPSDGQGEAVVFRGDSIPLVRLHDLWAIRPRTTDPSQALVVIVEENGRRGCLMVDEMVGQQQIVVKSLGRGFRDVRGWAGAAILSSGRVGLILDVDAVLDLALSA